MATKPEPALHADDPSWWDRLRRLVDRALGPAPAVPAPEGLDDDGRAQVVLWTSALLLLLLIFNAGFRTPGDLYGGWSSIDPRSLTRELYWVSWGYLFYLVIPLAIVLFVFKESPARYGLRFYLTKRTALLYGGMILFMLPVLFWASSRASFLSTYPFVKDLDSNLLRTMVIWEIAYVGRFICLEFFFRGYLLFGLEGKLGYGAVAVSTIPYGLIHFAKPFPEAMGALIAGAVLGYLALRTRTIIGGAIVHSGIAVSMDMLALWRRGLLF